MAQTPIKQFVRLGDLFFTEDYAGMRTPIAMCADEAQADWLAYTLTRAHGCPVVSWNEAAPLPGKGVTTTEAVMAACPAACECSAESGCAMVTPTSGRDKAPDGAPWSAHLDGPCSAPCEHAPDGGNHPVVPDGR